MADMHFDIPFTTLSKKGLGDKRRLEQREAFKKIIEYIQNNKIEYLFICGDFYEHEYVKQSTIEYINNKFKEIPNTKIYIVPGNHDPIIKNSYYNTFNWNNNVHIFKAEIEKASNQNIHIYGYGFDNFYMKNTKVNEIKIENKNDINILLTHASLDAISDEEKQYNPIIAKQLNEKGFDYVGLGHIHKPLYKKEENEKIIYPGSTISLGFDEKENHGIIYGEINEKKEIKIEFIKIDETEFKEKEIKIDEIISKEELIEKINNLNIEDNNLYKIILIGKRNFEINVQEIMKQIKINNIIKIKDNTQIKTDLQKLSKENNLKGLFIKNMLSKINNENKEQILKAIEIALECM